MLDGGKIERLAVALGRSDVRVTQRRYAHLAHDLFDDEDRARSAIDLTATSDR